MKNEGNNNIIKLEARTNKVPVQALCVDLHARKEAAPRITANPLKQHAPVRRVRRRRVSIRGLLSRSAVLLIIPVLVFRPILPLYAADEATTTIETLPVVVSDVSSTPPEEAAPEETAPTPDVAPPTENDAPEEVTPVTDETATTVTTPPTPTEDEGVGAEDEVVTNDTASTTDASAIDTATTTEEVLGDVGETGSSSGESVASTTEEVASTTPAVSETASSTTVALPEVIVAPPEKKEEVGESNEVIIAREIERRAEAMRQDIKKEIEAEVLKGCLTLDGVGYYCLKDEARMSSSSIPSHAITGVHADVLVGGADKEIIAEREGESVQLSNNDVEDAFPAKDVGGTHVVWQSQEGGRWQVYFADMSSSTPEVLQLTRGTESNFNPRVDGDSVVWQGWADGNWEIFLANRLAPTSYYKSDELPRLNTMLGIDTSWHVVRITENSMHDMFPAIAGGLVTWQSFEGGAWSVFAYSVGTGKTTKLSDDGTKSENPRFAVTWDERGPGGETRMVGYDLATGGKVDMTAVARNVIDAEKPYVPQAPRPLPEPLALPGTASSTGTSTPVKGPDDGAPDGLNDDASV